MESKSNTTALTDLTFIRHNANAENTGGYCFTLGINMEGKTSFSADHPRLKRSFHSKKVPDTVLGEIAKIARAAGDLGAPEEYDFTEESTSYSIACVYSLRWSDETETGTGTAKEQILQYLIGLAEKCVEEYLLEEEKHTQEEKARESDPRLFMATWMGLRAGEHLYREAETLDSSVLIGALLQNNCIDRGKSYRFRIVTEYGRTHFEATCFCADRHVNFLSAVVPNAVMEEIAEIVRAAGDLGVPERSSAPLSPPVGSFSSAVQPMYAVWIYGLLWGGGIETGLGAAREELLQYLYALAEKCADEEEKAEALQRASDNAPKEKWMCPACGFAENTGRFCADCGQSKPE